MTASVSACINVLPSAGQRKTLSLSAYSTYQSRLAALRPSGRSMCYTVAMSARTLIVVRGNSGSGKSTIARAVRDRYGRGCALIEQDYLRRTILREHDELES